MVGMKAIVVVGAGVLSYPGTMFVLVEVGALLAWQVRLNDIRRGLRHTFRIKSLSNVPPAVKEKGWWESIAPVE